MEFNYKKLFNEKESKETEVLTDVLYKIWEESSDNPVTFAKKIDASISECLDKILKNMKTAKKDELSGVDARHTFVSKFVDVMVPQLKSYLKLHD